MTLWTQVTDKIFPTSAKQNILNLNSRAYCIMSTVVVFQHILRLSETKLNIVIRGCIFSELSLDYLYLPQWTFQGVWGLSLGNILKLYWSINVLLSHFRTSK